MQIINKVTGLVDYFEMKVFFQQKRLIFIKSWLNGKLKDNAKIYKKWTIWYFQWII